MSASLNLPANVHVSRHPCLLAKLSLLRSKNTHARDVRALINEISLIVGCEALASALTLVQGTMVSCKPLPCPGRDGPHTHVHTARMRRLLASSTRQRPSSLRTSVLSLSSDRVSEWSKVRSTLSSDVAVLSSRTPALRHPANSGKQYKPSSLTPFPSITLDCIVSP
jgi:hypothetical protein